MSIASSEYVDKDGVEWFKINLDSKFYIECCIKN